MTLSETPLLYRSPSENVSSRGDSRDGNSVDLLSPLPDFLETVDSLTDGYVAATPTCYDQSWPSSSYYGYTQQSADGSQSQFINTADPKMLVGGELNRNVGTVHDLPGPSAHPQNYSQTAESTNPFANMSTSMLQSYLAGTYPFALSGGPLSKPSEMGGVEVATGSVPTGALFQQHLNYNTASPVPLPGRSPSPLLELEEDDLDLVASPSPEIGESSSRRRRRASDGGEPSKTTKGLPRRMSANLPMEEKLLRAQATEGLSKQDKRRVQNKLAQRAFRARSKVANRHVVGRLEHLEELTEQQADRISKMNDLIGRLQKENTGLKKVKFDEAMSGITRA